MIMRAFIYLLFPLYMRNLLFAWPLMKMVLTIFLKIPKNGIEVMVVLFVLLLTSKLVPRCVHHTCGGGHAIVCTPPPCRAMRRRIEPPTKFFKRGGGGLTVSQFLEAVCWERGVTFFRRGYNFYVKKLKSEIFNEKEVNLMFFPIIFQLRI